MAAEVEQKFRCYSFLFSIQEGQGTCEQGLTEKDTHRLCIYAKGCI